MGIIKTILPEHIYVKYIKLRSRFFPQKEEIVAEVKTQKPEKHSTFNKEDIYIVKKGDSLFSISKKIKGVTVSDLKKWNGISSEDIKPGMKLKING